MPGTKVTPEADESAMTEFFEKQECTSFRSEAIQQTTEISEFECGRRVLSDKALLQSESEEEDEEEDEDEEEEEEEYDFSGKTKLKKIRYTDQDNTAYFKISRLLYNWNINKRSIIISVLSDNECDNDADKILEVTGTEPDQNIRKLICRSLVEAAATKSAGIITGGQIKGVDQLIGNEVKERLKSKDKVPKFVLGISNWESIETEKSLLMNKNQTHLLLLDDGTQNKSGREDNVRQQIEQDIGRRLIYILIGGRINAFSIVKRALDYRLPVIIAMGTGGAADIISEAVSCEDDSTRKYLPKIGEKLFKRLEELLVAERIPATLARQVITNINTEKKLELLHEIVELLGQTRSYDGDAKQFREEIANLKNITTTNELLAGIKDLIISKQTQNDDIYYFWACDDEFDSVNLMIAVIEQMLVVNEIPQTKARQAIDHLEPDIINETLTKVKLVLNDLNAIRTNYGYYQDLLIKFDITSTETKPISSLIEEALKKGNGEITLPDIKCSECDQYHSDEERKMSETKLKRNADDNNVTYFIKNNFKKRECNRFRKDTSQQDTEICECGYSRKYHSDEAVKNELDQSKLSTKTFPTDAFGKLHCAEDGKEYFDWTTKLNSIRYVRLHHKTDVNRISQLLFDVWEMDRPDVIFSVISDSDFDNDASKGHEDPEAKSFESIQNIRKTICSSFVESMASTNAWIITGGLNKGVDQLIGNEVKKRLANREKIPRAVLGICNWGCLAKKKCLLSDSSGTYCCKSDSNPTGMSLNLHHTHFLLVDDGTQKESGCESKLREKVELALTEWSAYTEYREYTDKPLIYILIGGSVKAFRFVKRALANGIPVIIAKGTGGAADIISGAAVIKGGVPLEYLFEVFERLFNRLGELLNAGETFENKERQIIANIKFELIFKIIELLDKTRISNWDAHQFRNDISNLKKATASELLDEIKDLLISKQTPSDSSNHSTSNAEFDTVKRLRAVIKKLLVVNGIPRKNARQAVKALEKDVLEETLTKIRLVLTIDVNAIRKHDQLIHFDIKSRQKETIIVEALKKVKWGRPSDLYMLFADWDNEKFFKQLLLENWMRQEHETLFTKLLNERIWKSNLCKYVRLMMEHVGNCAWLTKPDGPLAEDFRENGYCKNLLAKLSNRRSNADTYDKRLRIKAKMLFIWCVQNHMPETAMLFWEQGQNCLAMALVAYYESMKQKDRVKNARYQQQQYLLQKQEDHVDRDIHEQIEQQQQFFMELALDYVRKCHMKDRDQTFNLLFCKVEDLANQTPLQIAVKANFGTFFYAYLLSRIWSAKLETNTFIPVILSVACPLLAPVLLDIDTDDNSDDKKLGCKIPESCTYFRQCIHFVDTPFVKFYYSFISFIAYLTLFSIVMLTDFRATISPSEIALIIWTFVLFTEEVQQSIEYKDEYWNNEWNYFDIGALVTYIVGFILRMIYYGDPTICPDCLYVARIVLAFSLMIFFCRTLQFLSINESLGPKIYMLRRLVGDLVGFMTILAVFISAYGVVSNVILYPNQPLSATLLRDVFYDAWWSVIQQFNREDAEGSNCNKNNVSAIYTTEYCSSTSDDNIDYVGCKENQCPANNWIVSVLLAFYALLTCIMLLNLLIAMFNSTFKTIEKKEEEVSKTQRFRLIFEYSSHSMIPPPLCVITYPFHIAKYLFKRLNETSTPNSQLTTLDIEDGCNDEESTSSQSWTEVYENRRISEVKDWENFMAAEFCKESKGKKGWPMPRMESGTSDSFDETQLGRYIIQKIQNQVKEQMKELSSEDTETRISRGKRASPKSTDAIDTGEIEMTPV